MFVCVSKQRGAPRPEPTWKVTRRRGTISAKVNVGGGGRKSGRKRNLREISTPACPALIPSSLPLLPLHPRSAEKAARWWPFQESPLPWLPVPHDPGPHQPLPVQRLAVPRCQNSKLSPLTPLSTPLQSSPKPCPVPSFPHFSSFWWCKETEREDGCLRNSKNLHKKFLVRLRPPSLPLASCSTCFFVLCVEGCTRRHPCHPNSARL